MNYTLLVAAGELNNYCYLLVLASKGATFDISQNLYCNPYTYIKNILKIFLNTKYSQK